MPGGFNVRPFLHRLRGVKIGKKVWIGQYVYIDEIHPEAITIGNNATIGINALIISHFYWGARREAYNVGDIVIEDDVFVGPHCVILPKVRIGRGAVIQAGTVVTRDVPPGVLWGFPKAVPLARVTTALTHETSYDAFLKGLRPFVQSDL